MAEAPYPMGIDLGTGGVRVGLFDREGSPVGFRAVEWETRHPQPGWAEQDPYDRDEGGFPVSRYEAVGVEDLLDKIPQRVLDLGVAVGGLARDAAHGLGLEAGTAVAEGGIDAHVAIPTAATKKDAMHELALHVAGRRDP